MYLDQAQGLGARKRRKTSEKVKKNPSMVVLKFV
jgi:hypothetical protein